MLTSSRWFIALTLVGSLGIASLASAADGVIYVDDLKSFDRANFDSLGLNTPTLRAGRPQALRTAPLAGPETTKKESFFRKLTPSWLRGEEKGAPSSQPVASRTPSRFDSAVKPVAHLAQQPQSQQPSQRTQQNRPTPRSGGIAMRRDTQRTGLLDGLMGTSQPKASKPKTQKTIAQPRPTKRPTPIASRRPSRTLPTRTPSNKPAALPLASRNSAPQYDLPKVKATPAVIAMSQPPRTPLVESPKPTAIATDEVVALEHEPQQFDDMVFVSDSPVTGPKAKMTPRPLAEPKGPRLFENQTAPQKLVTAPYPTAEKQAPKNDLLPTERARTLLAEAHTLASHAATADEFSAIVQRCRYVLAIDESSKAIAYANQLASWALNKRGEGFLDENRLAEAETDFLEALRSNATCWRAEHNLAVLEAQREEYESARKRFSRTIELNPEYAKAYCNRAALSTQSGDFSAAMQDYERAIEANPDLAIAHIGRGRVCHMLGHLDQALRHFDAAELLKPQDASIVIGRGDLLVDLGRYGHAKSAYERAISLDPSHPTAYRNLAWMQATCPVSEFRDGEAALINATKGAKLAGEEDDIALDTRAAALAATGQFEQAAELQKQAIEIAPESDAKVYRERLTMYERGEVFTSQPIGGIQQTTFTK